MANKCVTVRQDTVALAVEIAMNIWTALDLHTAGLRTNGETLSEVKALSEELKTVLTDEAQQLETSERLMILRG